MITTAMMIRITKDAILTIMPKAKTVIGKYIYLDKNGKEVNLFERYCAEHGITTLNRVRHFLAQIAHESCELTRVEENLNYTADGLLKTFPKYFTAVQAKQYAGKPQKIASRAYANRMGNGSEKSGDGWTYRGRGLIHLTGKSMYTLYKSWCGYDVVKQPELLAGAVGSMRSAGWYWNRSGCNQLADREDGTDAVLIAITKKINGGLNGYSSRKIYYGRSKKAIV